MIKDLSLFSEKDKNNRKIVLKYIKDSPNNL